MRNDIFLQLINSGVYIICGLVIGIFFDIFRILRKTFKTSNFLTYVEDTIFGVVTGLFLIFMLFVVSNGEIRFYIIFSLILGITLYFTLISKYFIKINVFILNSIKCTVKIIINTLLYPFRKIAIFLVIKPFRILKNKLKKYLKKSNFSFFDKKSKLKRGFIEKM